MVGRIMLLHCFFNVKNQNIKNKHNTKNETRLMLEKKKKQP
jgi:hypothetical protein